MPVPNAEINIQHINESDIKRVSVLGSDVELKWSKTDDILTIKTPSTAVMDELATVFKIEFE